MTAYLETLPYLKRRAGAAQRLASAAACSACHAGLDADHALQAVTGELLGVTNGVDRRVAQDIAGQFVALIYAARLDPDFLPTMRTRAASYAIRLSEYRAVCAEALCIS